ncbi:MAG: O-antigen ligase family protein [Bacillota bacterium]|jgi:O-antigen ligase
MTRRPGRIRTVLHDVYRLGPGAIWRWLHTQPASFWWVTLYLFIEYVRPQQLFPSIDVVPYGQITLGFTLLSLVLGRERLRSYSPADGALGVYALIVLLSTATAYMPMESIRNYIFFFSWVLVYFLITNIVVTEKRFVVFMLAFLLYNAQMSWGAMKQWAGFGFGFRTWGVTGGAGWFNNSGEFGVAMCIFFPIAFYFALGLRDRLPKWKFLILLAMAGSAVLGTVASSSRGALVGIAAAGMWMLVKSKYRARALIAATALVVVVLVLLPPEQKQRFSEAGEDKSSVTRLTYWRRGIQMTEDYPVLGIGFYNWMPYYQRTYGVKGQLPHNIFIQASAELGFTGLAAFLGLIGVTLLVNRRTRARAARAPNGRLVFLMAHSFDAALMGYLASGFFVTVLYYPFFWINLSMTVALHEVARRELVPLPARAVPRGRQALAAALPRSARRA